MQPLRRPRLTSHERRPKLVEVEWEVLKPVLSIEEALAPGAPILHEGQPTMGDGEKPEGDSNITNQILFEGGDLDAGFAEADVIVEGTFETSMVHQGYIEPHATLANAREDGTGRSLGFYAGRLQREK